MLFNIVVNSFQLSTYSPVSFNNNNQHNNINSQYINGKVKNVSKKKNKHKHTNTITQATKHSPSLILDPANSELFIK